MNNKITLILLALLIATPLAALSQDYAVGIGALEMFNDQAMAQAPMWVRAWLMIMMVSFALGLLFVWKHPIARWAVGGFIASMIIAMGISPALGIVPLSGFFALVHVICWSPALYQLLTKRPFLGPLSPFSIWSGLITAVIIFSFVFDIRDSVIFLNHVL
jgi:hypothetical protein